MQLIGVKPWQVDNTIPLSHVDLNYCHDLRVATREKLHFIHPRTKNCALLKSEYLWSKWRYLHDFSGGFFHTSLNDFASISCQFQKTITVTAHSFWFKILCYHTHIAPWSDSFCFERDSWHSETTEKHVSFSIGTVYHLLRHTASVRWRLSSGR